jgi:hypothetical protein
VQLWSLCIADELIRTFLLAALTWAKSLPLFALDLLRILHANLNRRTIDGIEDLSMRQVPDRSIWIGNAGDLHGARAVLALGIQAVVEVADSEQLASLPRDLIRLRFPLSDGGDNRDWLVRLAVESVASLVRAGVPTLVCCGAGLSRSVCLAAAALAHADGKPFEEMLVAVAKLGPADVSPHLAAQFQQAMR